LTNADPAGIDVHAHLVPPTLIEAVRDGGVAGLSVRDTPRGPALVSGDAQLGFPPGMIDVTARLEWLDAQQIGTQWVSPWLDLFTWSELDPATARSWAATVNRHLAEATAANPDRLRPVPFLTLAAGVDLAVEDLRSLVAQCAPPAVMLNSQPGRAGSLTDPATDVFWAAVTELRIPVLLHPPANGPSAGFTAPVLQNVSGRVIDSSVAVLDLLVTGVLDRFPQLMLIVVHGGGYLPYQIHRLDGLDRAGLLASTQATSTPSQALRRLYFDTVALDELSLELLVRRVGADHVLLGSDAPFPIGDPHPIRTVNLAGLSDADRLRVLAGNAQALAGAATTARTG
jgi:aminocarboxymuconate-semialdehyde decarboxylase